MPADPPLTPGALIGALARATRGAPPTTRGGEFWTGTGRAALLLALRGLGVGPGARVLLPAYLCESVVTPVLALGATPVFHPVNRGLMPCLDALEDALADGAAAVVLIHYFGLPGPIEDVIRLASERGTAVVEDCAHALFGQWRGQALGSFGDAAVYSPWKSLPMPDGGILRLNRPGLVPPADLSAPSPFWTVIRALYRAVGSTEQAVGWTPRLWLLRRSAVRHDMHARTSGAAVRLTAASAISRAVFDAMDPARVVAHRRSSYERLLAAVRNLGWARPLFDELPVGVCPLGLPILAENRDERRNELLRRGINVRTYWEELPPQVEQERFADAAWVRDRILVLPTHQALSGPQVDWMVRQLQAMDARQG
ncbi:MAG: DegT/DnrJ/EryC1/StrS family aminotransferase [Chloroflexota bacterium]